jgi:ribose/xylose/arabinose/galactoside ABC-type transport system permease subunit
MSGMNVATTEKKKLKLGKGSELTLLIAFILICVAFGILCKPFFTVNNFLNIGIYTAITGIAATTMTLILIQGCIDISVGSIMGFTGMVAAIMLRAGLNTGVAILVAFLLGLGCGIFNGALVSKVKINSMIATLATMSIFRGAAYLTNDGISVVINDTAFKWLGRGYVGPIPFLIVIMLAIYIVVWYVSKYTAFGRKIYATGANQRASYLSGIKTDRIFWIGYMLNGMVAGLAGILMAAQAGSGLPTAGEGYEMTVISACILGGTSLNGGKGSVWGAFLGALMLTTITNGLTMMAVPTFYQQIIKGAILLLAVFIDVLRSGGYKKK